MQLADRLTNVKGGEATENGFIHLFWLRPDHCSGVQHMYLVRHRCMPSFEAVRMENAMQAAVFARAHASGLGFGFSQFAVFSVYALAFWYGGQLMRSGEMTFSEVLKVCHAAQASRCRSCPALRGAVTV